MSQKVRNILKTACIVSGHMSMGLYLELVGPAMYDFKCNVSANYEEFARALVARSLGYFIGSISFGFLCDKFVKRLELFLSISFLFGAIGTGVAPWSNSLVFLAFLFLLQGLAQGGIDICNNTLIAKLWQKKAAAPLTALHFGFGIGALASPLIARPFLRALEVNITKGNLSLGDYNDTGLLFNDSIVGSPTEFEPNLVPPYSFSAALTLLFSLIFLVFHFTGLKKTQRANTINVKDESNGIIVKRQERKQLREIFSPGSCVGGNTFYGFQIFTLIFFFYINAVGGESAYGKFIFAYATDSEVNLDNNQAANLNTIFWLCFTIGRGAAILPSHFIPPHIMLFGELAGNVIITVILAGWSNHVPNVLWVCSGAMGLFLAPVFPGGFAWINLYVELKGMAIAVIFLGASLGGMVYQYLTGYLFEYYGPNTLMYIMVGYALILTSCFIVMFLLGRSHGQRETPERVNAIDVNGNDDLMDEKSKISLEEDEL